MPQIVAEYEALPEYDGLAKEVVAKYKDKFAGVNLDKIRAVVITNKERGESNNRLFDIKAVPMPILMDCKYSHYIIFYQEDWNALEQKHKLLLIAQTLCAIPVDENEELIEGKINPFDMKDFATMLRTFGTDYLTKDDVPDLLKEDIKWKE